MMQSHTRAHILSQACIALTLTLLLIMVNTATGRRPADHSPPPPAHSSDQTITLYTTGAATTNAGAPSSKRPIFTSQGPISHSGCWLRTLTRPGALRAGTVTVVDEQFHGKREFGLPLVGKLQGVVVTSLKDNSTSSMVAVKALFAGDGAEDSVRFFGVHHDGHDESHIVVVGGTGRYDGATGFAVVKAADVHETGSVRVSKAFSFRVHLK